METELVFIFYSVVIIIFLFILIWFFFYIPSIQSSDRLVSNGNNRLPFTSKLTNGSYTLSFITTGTQIKLAVSFNSQCYQLITNLPLNHIYTLTLTSQGQLIITNELNETVWTQPPAIPAYNGPYQAILGSNGSFCIYDRNGSTVWCYQDKTC